MAKDGALERIVEVVRSPLPRRPRRAPWLTLIDLDEGRLQLRAAEYLFGIDDPLLADAVRALWPKLDGQHPAEDLQNRTAPFTPEVVGFVLRLLTVRGAVYDLATAPPETPGDAGRLAALAHFCPDPGRVLTQLTRARVGLAGEHPEDRNTLAGAVAEGLRDMGVEAVSWEESSTGTGAFDLLIAAHPSATGGGFFERVNRACLAENQRWLRVTFEGPSGVLGPTVVPHQTACHTCYVTRLATHRGAEDHLRFRSLAQPVDDEGVLQPMVRILAARASLEVARLLTGFAPPISFGRIYAFSPLSPGASGHDVLRLPRCPDCGRRRAQRDPWDRPERPR